MEENSATVEQKRNDEIIESIKSIKSLKGTPIKFGAFSAIVKDDYSIEISSEDGVKISYPVMTESWTCLISWLIRWDDESKVSINNIFDYIIFPVATNMAYSDDQYIEDLAMAIVGLSNRNNSRGIKDESPNIDSSVYVELFNSIEI